MATYTVLVRTIAEQAYLNFKHTDDISILDGLTPEDILHDVWQKVIPIDYQLGDNPLPETTVVKRICKHYWMREIGMETVGLWKFSIATKLQEILPKYKEMARAQRAMGSIWDNQTWEKTHSGNFSTDRNIGETSETTRETSGVDKNVRTNTVTRDKAGRLDRELQERETSDGTVVYGKSETTSNTTNDHDNSFQTITNDLTDTSKSIQSFTQDHKTTDTGSSTKLDTSKDKFSDTPQNGLVSVETGQYLTSYRAVDNDDITNSDTSGTMIANDSGTGDLTDKHTGTVVTDTDRVREEAVNGKVEHGGSDTNNGTKSSSGTHLETTSATDNENVKEDTDGTRSDHESGTGSKNVTDNETGSDSYTDEYTGFSGDKVKAMYDYSQMYVNIYEMIIGEVAGFFMSIF